MSATNDGQQGLVKAITLACAPLDGSMDDEAWQVFFGNVAVDLHRRGVELVQMPEIQERSTTAQGEWYAFGHGIMANSFDDTVLMPSGGVWTIDEAREYAAAILAAAACAENTSVRIAEQEADDDE